MCFFNEDDLGMVWRSFQDITFEPINWSIMACQYRTTLIIRFLLPLGSIRFSMSTTPPTLYILYIYVLLSQYCISKRLGQRVNIYSFVLLSQYCNLLLLYVIIQLSIVYNLFFFWVQSCGQYIQYTAFD